MKTGRLGALTVLLCACAYGCGATPLALGTDARTDGKADKPKDAAGASADAGGQDLPRTDGAPSAMDVSGASNGGASGSGASNGGASGSGALDGGAADRVAADGAADDVPPVVARRLPLPCTAPFPTGFCFQSDSGDYIGGGHADGASGPTSVTLQSPGTSTISLQLHGMGTSQWSADFASGTTDPLVPGLYDLATRHPFEQGGMPGLSIDGNGRGCNMLTGRFAVEELARDPATGITRLSVTFEQHCEGGTPALRGVINFQATGEPDRTPGPDRIITLSGKIFRVAYDPTSNVAYGLDATNRRLAKIDLSSGTATYSDVVQVPNDACVDAKRGRLFVVNKGSSLITEYGTSDLKAVRDITWAGMDWGPMDTHFKITCAPDKLYVVDGAWAPGLFTVDGLDGAAPVATDHTAAVSGVGGLALNAAATNIYTWYQYGWSAGVLSTSVRRFLTSDLSMIDQTNASVPSFTRDPLDAPVLLDETRGLVFSKNKIFDATNLAKVVYTLPSTFDTFDGASENAYALDAKGGHLATKDYVYELTRFDIVAPTITPAADQLFFDANGMLWFLSISKGALLGQIVR